MAQQVPLRQFIFNSSQQLNFSRSGSVDEVKLPVLVIFVLFIVIKDVQSEIICRSDVCYQPVKPGPCEAAIPRWYFDATRKDCFEFIYGGCQGNQNNFNLHDACIQT